MVTQTYDANHCLLTRFSELVSGKWKPIILYLIERGINRFGSMQEYMPNISKKVLTEQLRELERDNLILRNEIKSKAPKVVVYQLTEQGISLRQLLNQIFNWSSENLSMVDRNER